MLDECGAKLNTLLGELADRTHVCDRCVAGDLDDGRSYRDFAVEGGQSADDTFTTDHGGLDHLTGLQFSDDRDYAFVRKVDPVDRVASLEQYLTPGEVHKSK